MSIQYKQFTTLLFTGGVNLSTGFLTRVDLRISIGDGVIASELVGDITGVGVAVVEVVAVVIVASLRELLVLPSMGTPNSYHPTRQNFLSEMNLEETELMTNVLSVGPYAYVKLHQHYLI